MKKQQNKRRKLIGIVTLITILGGVITMNWLNDEELKKKKYRQEQDRVMKYIGEHIELCNGQHIIKIECIEFQQNLSTGTWIITATVNDKYDISFAEDYLRGELITAVYNYNEFKFKQSGEQLTTHGIDKVKVVYYEGS
ncbi:membrane protein [Streptococcus equi subsp. zooepidemicus Sz105]|uniref:Membrane protein n=2 Tax=Streptococcus equi TaxID=1336 RepID=A0A380JSI1_9STRE|nr:membrane protein [Streptococcus equi subsp. zooepidemicus Sz105]SUN48103.1 membrane protein [Streptococcus equi subsp. equi]